MCYRPRFAPARPRAWQKQLFLATPPHRTNRISMTTITAPAASINRDRWFFTGMTVAMMVTAFAGFAPSFYLRSASHAGPPLTALVMFHGALMTVWMLAGVLQTSLIAGGSRQLHRTLGWMFAALALLIVVTGPAVGIAAIRRGAVPPGLT